jgi:hypothetical protein
MGVPVAVEMVEAGEDGDGRIRRSRGGLLSTWASPVGRRGWGRGVPVAVEMAETGEDGEGRIRRSSGGLLSTSASPVGRRYGRRQQN